MKLDEVYHIEQDNYNSVLVKRIPYTDKNGKETFREEKQFYATIDQALYAWVSLVVGKQDSVVEAQKAVEDLVERLQKLSSDLKKEFRLEVRVEK